MSDLFYVNAKIAVFPENRSRVKKTGRLHSQMIVANLSGDFYKYYSWFFKKTFGLCLEPPPFGPHITIADGRKHLQCDFQKIMDLDGRTIKVAIHPDPYLYWRFFALQVKSKELELISKSLGLTCNREFHVTLGKIPEISEQSQNLLTRILIPSEFKYGRY